MNILFVFVSTVPFGPNDRLAYKAAEELLRLGHKVLVSPWDWGDQNAPEYEQIQRKGALLAMRNRHERSNNFFLRQLQKVRHRLKDPVKEWQFADQFRPDAIIVSDPATYHFLSVPGLFEFLQKCDVPIVIFSNYNDENAYPTEDIYRKARSVFAKSSRCIFLSHRNLDVARRQLCHDLPQGVVVHPPPSLNNWSYLPYPKSDRPQYCMVARLECAVKGQALVLQVLSEALWRERDWSLSMFGKGPDESYLRDLVEYLGLQDKIQMCGFVNDVRSIWSKQQILIMASSGEGGPMALSEAMLCGRPAVVTDVGFATELVIDGVTGFIAQSATLASLRDALERSWVERNSWEEMGVRAHDWVFRDLARPPGNVAADAIIDAMK
jgi:glycosyltransferase involved in cell wall biosynthesis